MVWDKLSNSIKIKIVKQIAMKSNWFKKAGWVYIPVHPMGLLVTIGAIAVNGWFFIAIDRHSHSVSDTLINFFIYFSCVLFWWKWVAEKTS